MRFVREPPGLGSRYDPVCCGGNAIIVRTLSEKYGDPRVLPRLRSWRGVRGYERLVYALQAYRSSGLWERRLTRYIV